MKISNLADKSLFNFKRVSVSLNFSNRISTAKNTFEIKKVEQNFLKWAICIHFVADTFLNEAINGGFFFEVFKNIRQYSL